MLNHYYKSCEIFDHQDCFSIARTVAVNSNCNKKKVGACLEVLINNIRVAVISGCNYHDLSLCECVPNKKDPFVIHAEQNVLQHFRENCIRPSHHRLILYVTYEPCLKCARTIVKKGVNEVYFHEYSSCHDGLNYLVENNIKVKRWR